MASIVEMSALDTRVDALIAAQAERTPDKPAVRCDNIVWSYRELMARADAIAAALADAGAAPGALVGVHLTRSADMLAAVIAVMRAGCAYVPLDPDFPEARLAYMAADAGLAYVLDCVSSPAVFGGGARRIDVGGVSTSPRDIAFPVSHGEALAYVLYTSGSTGAPKGVAVEHRNVVNFLLSMAQEPGLSPDDVLLAVTTLSFDIAGLELFLPLTVGATVVIAGRDDVFDGERLKALIDIHDVTTMQATPSTWRLLLETGWEGGENFRALCGGEAFPADLARALAPRCGALWNMYGPTETTIWSTCYRVPESGMPVLIGSPIANTSIHIIDQAGRRAPQGVPGEIMIGGAGVARGYLGRDDLTAERFVPDPFSDMPGARLYRTGDFGRVLANGLLEFRERTDAQVKVRGFRVELGEIESAICDDPSVRRAVCRIFEPAPGDARIAAYAQLAEGASLDAHAIRESLTGRLPGYMIPQHFLAIDAIPMTPNGKVDRRALPEPDISEAPADAYVSPAGATEEAVAAAYAEAFGMQRVSASAHFFDLGGHSILAMRVLSILRRAISPNIALRQIFEQPVVRDLAREIDGTTAMERATDVEEFVF